MLQFGMRAHDCCLPLPAEQCFDTLAANGLRHIQLAFEKSISDYDFSTGHYSAGFARYLGDALDRRSLHTAVLGCYINPVHPDETMRRREVERFVERLRYAKHLRADMVGTETGRFSADMSVTPRTASKECWAALLDSFSQIAQAAEALGVTVGVEGVFDHTVSTPERMAQFLRELRSPAVEVILDFANLVSPDACDPKDQEDLAERAFALYGDRISVLHLKDCVFENGAQKCVRPGTGVVDWKIPLRWISREKPQIIGLLEESSPERYAQDCAFFEQTYHEAAAGR